MSTILSWYCYVLNFKVPGYFVTIYINLVKEFWLKVIIFVVQFLQNSIYSAIFHVLLVTPFELIF
jgi:hypothetical protein